MKTEQTNITENKINADADKRQIDLLGYTAEDVREKAIEILRANRIKFGKIIVIKDKWGYIARVYFPLVEHQAILTSEHLNANDYWQFTNDIKNFHEFMIYEAKLCYSDKWEKYLKIKAV